MVMSNSFEVDHEGLKQLLRDLKDVSDHGDLQLDFSYVYSSDYSQTYNIRLTRRMRHLLKEAGILNALHGRYRTCE